MNQYAYVGGTPTIYRDPSGRIFLPLVTGAIGGIGGFGGNLAWQLYNNPGCINWKSAFVAGGVGNYGDIIPNCRRPGRVAEISIMSP
jgi:hypothetical protein